MNTRRSPRRILCNHAKNQVANLFGDPPSTDPGSDSGDQPPVESETRPVPADDGFRSHDNQRILPLGPNPLNGYPKQLVEGIQSRSRMAALEHCELLPQREIFEQNGTARAKQAGNRAQEEPDDREHRSNIAES